MYVYEGMGMCHDVSMPQHIRKKSEHSWGWEDPHLSFYCGYREQTQAFGLVG